MRSLIKKGFIYSLLIFCFSCSTKTNKDNSKNVNLVKTPFELLSEKISKNPKEDSLFKLRAEMYLSMGEAEKALADARIALQLNPEKTEYNILLGDVYLAMGNVESCKKALLTAFDMDPRNIEPSLKLAELNLFLQDYDKVYLYCNNALEIDKFDAKSYFIKGFALLEQKDTNKAVVALQKATQNDADYYDAFILLGKIFDAKKDQIAGNYLKTAVRIRPNSIEARYNYGLWLQEHEMIDAALAQYTAIITINPTYSVAWYNIGYIELVFLQNYKKAIDSFTKAIECDNFYAEAFYNRGLAFEQLKQFDNAKKDYVEALRLKNNYDLAIEGLNRIEKNKYYEKF